MHYLTALLTSLLALLGYQEPAGFTTITRVSTSGIDTLFSKIDVADGRATFRCLDSGSGRCYYRVFSEHCDADAMPATAAAVQCRQHELGRFDLAVGQLHRVQGLPVDFSHCVMTVATKTCRRD